jgi:hypothetical protein
MMKMDERVTIILLINGFKYSGNKIKENKEFITITDFKTNSNMTFPKKMVMITREVKDDL